MVPQGANRRWSLDFASDALLDSRRFRILCVIDNFTREYLTTVVDNSLSGVRVARELDRLRARASALWAASRGAFSPCSRTTTAALR